MAEGRHEDPLLTIVVIVGGLALFAIPAAPAPAVPCPPRVTRSRAPRHEATYDLIDEHFGPGYNGPLVMTSQIVTSDDPLGDVEEIEERIETVDGVEQVIMATRTGMPPSGSSRSFRPPPPTTGDPRHG